MDQQDDKIDADILKGREDILRARKAAATNKSTDEVRNKPSVSSHAAGGLEENRPGSTPREPSSMMKAVFDANKQIRAERQGSDVPVFDVAHKILATQRQAASAKRTAPPKMPAVKPAVQARIQTRTDQIEYNRPSYNSLIAEIVTRDIDGLCRGQAVLTF
jgi:hypothetical protein